MKKILPWLLVLVLPFVASALSSPEQASSAVQVPEALKNILSGVLLSGVLLGLQVVFDWSGLDLRGIGAAVAAALSGFVVGELQGYINLIPVQFDYLVTIGFQILTVVLSGLGFLRLLVSRERGAALLR